MHLFSLSQEHLHPATCQCVHHASQNPEGCAEQLVYVEHQQGTRLTQVDAFQTLQGLLKHRWLKAGEHCIGNEHSTRQGGGGQEASGKKLTEVKGSISDIFNLK